MEIECSFKRCYQDPVRCCKCTEPWTLLCSDHFHSPPGDFHKISSITNLLNPSYKNQILQNLLDQAKKIKAQRQSALKFAEELILFIQKDLKAQLGKLHFLENNISNLIQEISTIRIIPDIELPEFRVLKQVANGDFPEGYDIKELFSVHDLLMKYERNLNDSFDFDEPTKIPLMFTERDSNLLNIVDLDLMRIQKLGITGISSFGIFGASCLLPNNQAFYYGGYLKHQLKTQEYSNKCYIIDLESGKFTEYAPGKPKDSLGSCAFFNNEVFIFGGYQNRMIGECEKFCIASNKWKAICPLPKESDRVSSVEFNSKIYLSGFFSGHLYEYDPQKNNYFSILESKNIYMKSVFKSENTLFLFERKKVFWLNSGVWESGDHQDILSKYSFLICYPVVKKYFVYLLFGVIDGTEQYQKIAEKKIVRFNTRTKQVRLVRSIN